MGRTTSVIAAALLFLSAFAAVPVAADEVTTIDTDHGLVDRSAIESFEEDGAASTSVVSPNMRLTVAEDHDDVGLSGFFVDSNKVYVRFQYNESLPRTVRVKVPSEYFYPVTNVDESAVNAETTADFAPTADGRYTAVTVRFTGQTDAVFVVRKEASFVFWGRSQTRKIVKNATGYEPPRIGTGGEWYYVPNQSLAGNSTYPLNGSSGLTVQMDAAREQGVETWVPVPECTGGDAEVCYYKKRGVESHVFLLSRSDDPPAVRWKPSDDAVAEGKGIWKELTEVIPKRLFDDIDSWFGGDD